MLIYKNLSTFLINILLQESNEQDVGLDVLLMPKYL